MPPSGQRGALSTALFLGAIAACTSPGNDAAIAVTVRIGAGVKATCVRVLAAPGEGPEQLSTPIVRDGRDELKVAVMRSAELSGALRLTAQGYLGEGCEAGTLNEQSGAVETAFAAGAVKNVTLELHQVPAQFDADEDGYRSDAEGGPDCDDANASAHPGATERCDNGFDDDCAGGADCAEAACAGQACAPDDACGSGRTCIAGACGGGQTVVCPNPPSSCHRGPGSCIPATGACLFPVNTGTACDGGLCRSDGICAPATTEVLCGNGVDDDGDGPADCADSDCASQSCSDGDPCTSGETCGAAAGSPCAGGSALACNTPPGECFSASGSCVAGAGCRYPVRAGSCTGGTCQPDGGCSASPTFGYAPSNFEPAAYPTPSAGLRLDCGVSTFDSTPDASTPYANWCGQSQPAVRALTQDGGAEAALLLVTGLTIGDGGTLRLVGTRPVVIGVFGDVAVRGHLSAGAQMEVPGAGGSSPVCGNGAGWPGLAGGGSHGGGGGGGFSTGGGRGGDGASSGIGGLAGAVHGDEALRPLHGGCSGGRGGTGGDLGGGGGGAVQLSAAGTVTIAGKISAPGGGGRGGDQTGGSFGGAGGGGSGGAVLVEGNRITLELGSAVTANGGSGGEGDGDNGGASPGDDGVDGHTEDGLRALGGNDLAMTKGGAGGNGGALLDATPGWSGSSGSGCGGGGGGAAGRVRFNVVQTCSLWGTVSPVATSNKGIAAGCP